MELKLSRQIDSDFYEPVHLFLYDAVLTWLCIGPTPVEICQMAKLEKLVLHGNQLTGQHFYMFIQSRGNKIVSSNRLMNQFNHLLFDAVSNLLT